MEHMSMEKYRNHGKDSGVFAFQIDNDSITIQFQDKSTYLYNYVRPGQQAVEHMKMLARAGEGLNSFINRSVRKNYFEKLI